jgi:hypothetical protein
MPCVFKKSALLVLSALLSACVAPVPTTAIIGLDKPALLQKLGKPKRESVYLDGERWDYSRGHEGIFMYFVHIDSEGRVARYEQVLSEENFARIKPGMTKAEVIDIIGEGPRYNGIARGRGSVWSYKNFWSSVCIWFQVEFDADHVVRSTGYNRRPTIAACR